jgi:ribosome-binding factor A
MSGRIRQILSELLIREVSDPRLHGLTVTEVTLDREFMFADVYINALGDEARRDEVMDSLKRASGFLRRETGKRIRLRNTPALQFHWDTTLDRAEHINQLAESLDIPPADATDDFSEDDTGSGDDDDAAAVERRD